MGFLSANEVITCSATDLIGEWQGHTGPKVIAQFDAAVGKVLFIDEAYRLTAKRSTTSTDFVREATEEIIDAMTQPRYAGNMVVILAGYTDEMEELLRSNPGLRSRFPVRILFPPMDSKQALTHLKNQLAKVDIGLDVPDNVKPGDERWKKIHRLLTKLGATRGWASGRDVETLAKTIVGRVFIRAGQADEVAKPAPLAISTEELIKFLQNLLRERKTAPDDEET
jgi:SpoVK/Ycf46/Vps4 family AAA+-type ATPase